jgi:ubiquinone/menaquinone biosynthesis C-methylase UbiE
MFNVANDARFWDRIARKYAADPIADMAGYERTLERTRHYLKSDDIAFEFGCGTGTTALKLAPSVGRIVATDISSEMIAIAREKAAAEGRFNAAFEVATPDATPWPDETFDVALGFNILHLVAAREAALRGVHRLLKPGGLFQDAVPQGNEPARAHRRARNAVLRQGALCELSRRGRPGEHDRGWWVRDRRARAPRLAPPGRATVPSGKKTMKAEDARNSAPSFHSTAVTPPPT